MSIWQPLRYIERSMSCVLHERGNVLIKRKYSVIASEAKQSAFYSIKSLFTSIFCVIMHYIKHWQIASSLRFSQ